MVKNITILGLGYVGLPLTLELAKHHPNVVGFDLNKTRVLNLSKGIDSNHEYSHEELTNTSASFSSNVYDSLVVNRPELIIVTVPTPITRGNKPDLEPLRYASEIIGKNGFFFNKPIIVFESTVYPGLTEEFCVPLIEEYGNVKYMKDFFVGYSPERVNPGDKVNTINTITKVVSGCNDEVLDVIDSVYSKITKTHRVSSIKVAEASKVIENSQRDLNIAFVNELALIFDKLGVDTLEVLEAASTKWNFLNFKPGLVGGHCISVDPYYLTYKAEDSGIISQVILAGRRINDSMAHHIVELTTRALNNQRKAVNGSTVLILGATFKENCKDVRNSKVEDIILELETLGAKVHVHDPYYEGEKIDFHRVEKQGIIKLTYPAWIHGADVIIYAVTHDKYVNHEIFNTDVPIIDIKGALGIRPNVIRL